MSDPIPVLFRLPAAPSRARRGMARVLRHAPCRWMALFAIAALVLVACDTATTQVHTGDVAAPNIFPGEVVTEQGGLGAGLYTIVFAIAVAIFILVEGLIIWIAIRYRRRPTDTQLPPQTHGHDLLEIGWTVIPAIIVTALFVLSMGVLVQVDARSPQPDLTVDVTAFQWQWTMAYPEYRTAAGGPLSYTGAGIDGPELVVPVNETIRFRLHAQDVIHSFYVPQFFYKRDAIPGRVNEFDVDITREGTYGGQCAEFCGLGHAEMFFTVRAVPRAEFDTWIEAELERANASPTPGPSPTGPGPTGPPAGTVLRIATTPDAPVAFTESTLTAPAATDVTVEYLNDSALPHNIAFFEGSDASAPRIAATEVGTGPGDQQTVTFTTPAQPGSYFFHCDVHPQQMTGTFEVTP